MTKFLLNNYKLLKSSLLPSQLGYIIFYVTNRCNFHCDFCFYHEEIRKGLKENELSVSEIEKITQSVGALTQLSLTGGEPFLREEFFEITDLWIKNTGVKFITIPTNGWFMDHTITYLEKILPRYPKTYFRLAFSIDGIEQAHDKNRSMIGSYHKIVETYNAISPLRKHYGNLVLDSNTMFTSQTENQIIDILSYLNKHFSFDNHTVTFARGNIKDETLKSHAAKKYYQMSDYLDKLERTKEKRFLYPIYRGVRDVARRNFMKTVFEKKFITPCVAGRKVVVIGETGEVYPCEILNKTMGNLRDCSFDLKKLLSSPENIKLRKWITTSRCQCSFECAIAANTAWRISQYPKILIAAFKNIGKKWQDFNKTPSNHVEKTDE